MVPAGATLGDGSTGVSGSIPLGTNYRFRADGKTNTITTKRKGEQIMSSIKTALRRLAGVPASVRIMVLAACTAVVVAVPALATETEGAKKVKEVTTSVSSEGVEIILAVLGGLVALIALSIILPKAVGFIRRFV